MVIIRILIFGEDHLGAIAVSHQLGAHLVDRFIDQLYQLVWFTRIRKLLGIH